MLNVTPLRKSKGGLQLQSLLLYLSLFCIFLLASITSAHPSHLHHFHHPRHALSSRTAENLTSEARVRSATSREISAARTLVRDAQAKAAVSNRNRLAHPFITHRRSSKNRFNKRQALNATNAPPQLFQVSEAVAKAAALLTEIDAPQIVEQNITRRDNLQERGTKWWMADKEHRGAWPWGGDRSYQVFRDVTDAKWATDGAARCVPDGKTDCTAAIENAMKAGKRCGAGCNGSTTKQAIVFFPSGTYLISRTIEIYFGTQMIGDARSWPLIVASPSFVGLGVFSVDHYVENGGVGPDGGAKEWYINTANFYRQIRNFSFDLRKAPTDSGVPTCGVHYQVGQATSIANVNFLMSKPLHYGIFAENGSGGHMSDMIFEGGGFGIYGGSQQFTAQRITFSNVDVAVQLIWDWGWSWKTVNIIGGTVGFKLVAADGDTNPAALHNTGSIIIIDSTFSGTKTAIQTFPVSSELKKGTTGITLENVLFKSVGQGVADTLGKSYYPGGSQNIHYWILGPIYFSPFSATREFVSGYAQETIKRSDDMTTPVNPRNLPVRPFFERSKPQYTANSWSDFVSVKSVGAKGDGVTDDRQVLQTVIDAAAQGNLIVYFDAGTYIVKDTLFIPPGSRIVGEAWAQIAAQGAAFAHEKEPKALVRVGSPGDVGNVEIQDILFTTQGVTPGAILVEWNIKHTPDELGPKAGMWDCHVRIGGAVGTDLTSKQCPPSLSSIERNCKGGAMMMHITPSASAYLENVWLWVADHDIDDPDLEGDDNNMDQCSIFVARGLLIESTEPVWLYGTASEHATFYQYNFYGAKNIFATMIQTESPYYQPIPKAPAPFAGQIGVFAGDKTYDDCPKGLGCDSSWALQISNSDNIYIAGAGLYSWFDSYDQTKCVDASNCQKALVELKNNAVAVQINNLITIGAKLMIVSDGVEITSAANLAVDFHPFWSQITSFGHGNGYNSQDVEDDEELPDFNVEPCTAHYDTMEDLDAAHDSIPSHCRSQYTLAALKSVYDNAILNYNRLLSEGYDQRFAVYAQAISDSAGKQVADFVEENGKKFFTCDVGEDTYCCSRCKELTQAGDRGCKRCFEETADKPCTRKCGGLVSCEAPIPKGGGVGPAGDGHDPIKYVPNSIRAKFPEPCPPDYSERGPGPTNPHQQAVWWTLPQDNHDKFFGELYENTGIPQDKISFVRRNRGNSCAPADKGNPNHPCQMDGYDYNFPQPHGFGAGDVQNPKKLVQDALTKSSTLGLQLNRALGAVMIKAYNGDVEELIDAVSLPIIVIAAAVDSMQKVEDAGIEIEEQKRKALILAFITAILFFVPIAGELLGSIAALADIASVITILGALGNVALDIYTVVDDPHNAPLAIFSLVLAPLALTDLAAISKAATIKRSMKAEEVAKLGGNVAKRMHIVQKIQFINMKEFLSLAITTGLLLNQVASRPLAAETGLTTPIKPQQTEKDEAPNCDLWYIAEEGETCLAISQKTGINLNNLYAWNPTFNAGCFKVKAGWGYCIDAPASEGATAPATSTTVAAPTTSTSTTTTTTTTATSTTTTMTSQIPTTTSVPTTTTTTSTVIQTPVPVQADQVDTCTGWKKVQDSDTCDSILKEFASNGLTNGELTQWNPALKSDCSGLFPNYYVCISIIPGTGPKITTTTAKPTTTAVTTTVVTTTTKSTTTPPPPPPVPTFTPQQFPPIKGKAVQCVTATPGKPAPPSNYAGNTLARALKEACAQMLPSGSKYLEKGLPYGGVAAEGGKNVNFYMKIWLGGFPVTNELCVEHMMNISNGCNTNGRTFGGCAYSSDLNFQACIFP
ncbi:hypothetical protein H072_10908 [Dactylellina haptotyla CBS 200.50]|uniref:LysM domain-containing protein n=1 Tax=Dactylellina haptotyla (strain CBS 200.50) TaxID=1284197 RepID=S8B979_DACHA|nr:hypothetical protein H072_10908 [Dactylellina haptotyla CBS 200.50]